MTMRMQVIQQQFFTARPADIRSVFVSKLRDVNFEVAAAAGPIPVFCSRAKGLQRSASRTDAGSAPGKDRGIEEGEFEAGTPEGSSSA
jgi:hypothetical protein